MRLRGPTASFCLALLIVGAAAVAIAASHPADIPDWPALAVPMKPAWFLVYGLGGGPHGIAGEWYQGPVTFATALAMWWAILEGCRRSWNAWRVRSRIHN
jgi:hypothetical protein